VRALNAAAGRGVAPAGRRAAGRVMPYSFIKRGATATINLQVLRSEPVFVQMLAWRPTT